MTSITKYWAIWLIVLTTLLTTAAQVFLKEAVGRLPIIFTNIPLLIGVVLYAIGAVVMIIAFKGGEVSTLYPIIATSYLWVLLFSFFLFKEEVHLLRWIGIVVIMLGVVMVGFGNKTHKGIEHAEVI